MKVIFKDETAEQLPTVETTLLACYRRKRRRSSDGTEFEIYILATTSGEFIGQLSRFDPDAFEEDDRVLIRYFEKNGYKHFLKVEKANG